MMIFSTEALRSKRDQYLNANPLYAERYLQEILDMFTINLAEMRGDLTFEEQNDGEDVCAVITGPTQVKKIYFAEVLDGEVVAGIGIYAEAHHVKA
jgi:hypothetical protein